jgi:hypothetical protein
VNRRAWLRVAAPAVAVVSVPLVAGGFVFAALNGWSAGTVQSVIATSAGFLTFSAVGLLIILRRPGNTVGWICAGTGFFGHLTGFATEYAKYSYFEQPVPLGPLFAWFSAWTWAPMVFLPLTQLLLLFPDGSALSTRWRRFGTGAAVLLVLVCAGSSLLEGDDTPPRNPLAFESTEHAILALVAPLFGVLALTILVSMLGALLRFRRSQGIQRQQMKWFAFAVAVNLVLQSTNQLVGSDNDNTLFGIGLALLATAIGVAVLRYRLYDIDRIVSRTLTYGLLTAGLAAFYLGLVIGLEALLRPVSGGSDLAVVITTLVVAALFLPARRRVQAVVDRRFNRRRYNAQRTIEAFSARLREQVDLDTLRYELLAVVDETMQPSRAGLWLRERPQT